MGRHRAALGLTVLVAVTALVTVYAVAIATDPPRPLLVAGPASPSPSPSPLPDLSAMALPMPLHGENEVVGPDAWHSWTLVDRRTSQWWGSPNADEPNRSVSMIKVWLAALYLRRNPNPSQEWVELLSSMIRDSNNRAADAVHRALGGNAAMTAAMTEICGVEGPYIPPGYWWASTWISSYDAAMLGVCIANFRVANVAWTQWLLGEMRLVRGNGDFGIRTVFDPAVRPTIAIKNGWNTEYGYWWVNCLAIGETWVLVVESRSHSAAVGVDTCESVTRQLLASP